MHIDYLIITGNDSAAIDLNFKEYLSTYFHMKDIEPLKYFLGVEVADSSKVLYLSQRKYAFDILMDPSILEAKPVAFPMAQNHHLGKLKAHCYLLLTLTII